MVNIRTPITVAGIIITITGRTTIIVTRTGIAGAITGTNRGR